MINKKIIYADHAATTALDVEAFEEMKKFLIEDFSNPSQSYSFSKNSKKAIKEARKIIANCINADEDEIFFTSGGTESNNWAIKSILTQNQNKRLITSNIEHHAIIESCKDIEKFHKFHTNYIRVNKNGVIIPEVLEKQFSIYGNDIYLTSIMLANNEYGAIQPIKELACICHQNGSLFHTDAVQAVGHIAVDVKELGVDMLSSSAHKFNGPKGIGFLYIKKGLKLHSFISGGSQEKGRRAGTENVASIVGMSTALKNNYIQLAQNTKHISNLEQMLLTRLHSSMDFICNTKVDHIPGNISLSFKGVSGETLMHRLDLKGIMVSTGSACDSVKNQISHAIRAIGVPNEYAQGTIRISLGKENTEEDIHGICCAIEEIVPSLIR